MRTYRSQFVPRYPRQLLVRSANIPHDILKVH
jgi:hypothetical protein